MIKTREILFIICILFPATLLSQTTYYVSSSSGNDSNSGTTSTAPWKTLTKVNSRSYSPGDNILFLKGDKWEGTINVTSSGSSGNPITYGAYGSGNKPIIYGSKKITGWETHSGNIYKAYHPDQINQLFINNNRARISREPNSGYVLISSTNGETALSSNTLNSSINYSGAKVNCRTLAWAIETIDITSSSSQNLTLTKKPVYKLDVGDGFWLSNKLEFLDQPGEWYYDSSTKTVYLSTPNGDSPSNYDVRGSSINYGININNKAYISITDLELSQQQHTAIFTDFCKYLTVDNVKIYAPECFGIYVNHDSYGTYQNMVVDGANHIGLKSNTTNSIFSSNTINNTGLIENLGLNGMGSILDGTAIYNFAGGYNTFQYNKIDNAAYNGIRWDTDNCIIDKNYINNTCIHKDDGGGIYTWASSSSSEGPAGSVVSNNIVLNSFGTREGGTLDRTYGYGIYMDNHAHDVRIVGNTVAHCGNAAIYLHANKNIVVETNTLMDARQIIYVQAEDGLNKIRDNIMYALARDHSDFADQMLIGQRTGAKAEYNNNRYINHYKTTIQFRDQNNYYNFADWKAATQEDQNSTFDGSPLAEGEFEKLFYNDSKTAQTINLGAAIYKDIDGNVISGSIVLEPYTSKILIFTSGELDNTINQNPTILNQHFELLNPIQSNELIGKIVASDPNPDQTLQFAITAGNNENLFSIDPNSGDFYSTTEMTFSVEKTYNLTIEVTDSDLNNPLSSNATVTVNIKIPIIEEDTESPIVTSFDLPNSSSDYTAVINNIEASDNEEIVGYLIKEDSLNPPIDDAEWTTQAPEAYTFSNEGLKTVYLWVKDASGNISDPVSSSIEISLPDLSLTSSEYLFEETSGNTVIDSEGNNDGILTSEFSRINGYSGKGVQLNGAGYIFLGKAFDTNIQDKITLSARIKPDNVSSDYQGIIMHGGPGIDTYALYIHPGLKRIAFKTSGTSDSWTSIDNINKLWDGSWHHLAVTYDGQTKNIYLDNLLLISESSTGTIDSGEGYNLYIGAGRDESQPTLLYQGLIDEVRISNRALSSYEIVDLVNYVNPDDTEQNSIPVINPQTFEFEANVTTNTIIGQVVANDTDNGQSILYEIIQGNEAGLFSINQATGEISTSTSIFSTTDQTHQLTVQVTDDDSTNPLSAEATITINLIGVILNKSPVIDDQSFEVASDITINDIVANVSATDPDEGQTLNFEIISGNEAGLFSINSATGELFLISSIPGNVLDELTLEVKVTDSDSTPLSATANILLTNLRGSFENQQPVIYNQSFTATAPLSLNSTIGQVIANDPDEEQTLSYSIIQGNESGLFRINAATGEILTNQSISENTEFYGEINVKVVDSHNKAPLSATAAINIQINRGVTNQSPVAQDLIVSIDGDIKINDYIGQVVASDPNPNQTLSYSIIQGNSDGLFTVEQNTGEIYAISSMFTTTDIQRNLVVEVKDNSSTPLSAVSNVTINISGIAVNHSPEIADQSFEVRKNDRIGDVVGNVQASDPDSNQNLNFAIVGGDGQGFFEIDSSTGALYITSSFNTDVDTSILLTIKVSDNGNVPLSATATIAINIVINGKIVKGEVNNNNPKRVVLYSDKKLQSSSLKSSQINSDFVLSGNKFVQNVTIDGHNIYLDIDSEYESDETIHATYEKKSTVIYDISGNEIEAFENLDVENNILGAATAIDPNMNTLEVSFYPNPTTGIINIKASSLADTDSEITLYNMIGKIVEQQILNASFGSIDETIDISHLSEGTYIIRLVCAEQVHTNKIILR